MMSRVAPAVNLRFDGGLASFLELLAPHDRRLVRRSHKSVDTARRRLVEL
jgi:hypothetical protein